MAAAVAAAMDEERDTATLHQAAREGQLELLKVIITRKTAESDETVSQSSALSSLSTQSQHRISFLNEADGDGMTPLMYAARYNRLEVAQELLKAGASPTVKGDDGLTPIHLAAKHGHDRIVQLLLENQGPKPPASGLACIKDNYGSTAVHFAASKTSSQHLKCLDLLLSGITNPDLRDESNMTPLHTAAAAGNVEAIQRLSKAGASLRCKDCDDGTPMHLAAMQGHFEVGKLLLQLAQQSSSAEPLSVLEDKDCEGNQALHLAIQNGNVRFINLLLEEGANPNASTKKGHTPLHMAARNGHVHILKILRAKAAYQFKRDHKNKLPLHRAAEQGRTEAVKYLLADETLRPKGLRAQSYSGFTPFISACWSGHESTARALLELGADPCAVDKAGKNSLHWAVDGGYTNVVNMLLGQSSDKMQPAQVANLVQRSDDSGLTPLHVAAGYGYHHIVDLLLDAGAIADAKDSDENTPLHYAVRQRHIMTVETLLKRDPALVKDEDDTAQTALHLACRIPRNTKIVSLLLDNGAYIDAADDFHQTPLHEAAAAGLLGTVKILIENDAAPNLGDKKGNTPLHYACQNGHSRIVAFLLDYCIVNLQTSEGLTPLDLAATNHNYECAQVILDHAKWRLALKARVSKKQAVDDDEVGMTPFKRMIKELPEAAMIVLRKSITDNSGEPGISKDSENYEEYFDYTVLDEAPSKKNGVPPMLVMTRAKRGKLLSHPLVDSYLQQQWRAYGLPFYGFHLVVYSLFVALLTVFVLDNNVEDSIQDGYELSAKSKVAQAWCTITVLGMIVGELIELSKFDWKGYLTFENLIDWALYISTLLFLLPLEDVRTRDQWYAGSVAIFLAWMNLVIYVRRVSGLGVYIIMMQDTLRTVARVLTVFSLFIFAYAIAFHMLLQNQDENSFTTIGQSVARVFVMMTGEFEFDTIFLGGGSEGCRDGSGTCVLTALDPCHPCRVEPLPFSATLYIIFVCFVVFMHIVLMNLLIGLAVGDIEAVSNNAEFARQSLKVEFISNARKWVPARFLELQAKRAIRPHGVSSIFSSIGNVLTSMHSTDQAKPSSAVTPADIKNESIRLQRKSRDLRSRVTRMRFRMQDHSRALAAIAHDLDVDLQGLEET